MKLVKMVRSSPELPGGPTTCNIQPQDVAILEARGWTQDGKSFDAGNPAADEVNDPDGQPSTEDAGNPAADDKEALVKKAIELKTSHPKAVKAAPSQIPLMSVEKLSALIEEAEAVIASQDEE